MRDLISIWRLLPKAALGLLFSLTLISLAYDLTAFDLLRILLKGLKDNVGEVASVTAFFTVAIFMAVAGAAILSALSKVLFRSEDIQAERRARDIVTQEKNQLVEYFTKRMESSATDAKQERFLKKAAGPAIKAMYLHLEQLSDKSLFDSLIYHDQLTQDQKTFDYTVAQADAVQYSWILVVPLPFSLSKLGISLTAYSILFVCAAVWIVVSRHLHKDLIDKAAHLHASWIVNSFSPGEIGREDTSE